MVVDILKSTFSPSLLALHLNSRTQRARNKHWFSSISDSRCIWEKWVELKAWFWISHWIPLGLAGDPQLLTSNHHESEWTTSTNVVAHTAPNHLRRSHQNGNLHGLDVKLVLGGGSFQAANQGQLKNRWSVRCKKVLAAPFPGAFLSNSSPIAVHRCCLEWPVESN